MNAMNLGNYHSSGWTFASGVRTRSSGYAYLDVEPVEGLNEQTIEWFEYITEHGYSPSVGTVVIPKQVPIISIDTSGCHTRDTALGVNPTWSVVQEGWDKEFIQLRKITKTGAELGFALYFFSSAPTAGLDMIRLKYHYGYNIPTNILREYATLKTSEKLIFAKISSSTPGGLSQFQTAFGPRFAQIDFDKKILEIDARCKEIEDDFFPIKRNVAMGFI